MAALKSTKKKTIKKVISKSKAKPKNKPKAKISKSKFSPIKSSNPKSTEKIIITAALPYANGSLHVGNMLEHIQTDIFIRFMKLIGKDALGICASDMHGTPIEVNARKVGIEPKQFAEKYFQEHQEDLAGFLVKYDNYYHTHSPENKELAEYFFSELKKKKLIYRKKIEVIYCLNCARSLPDRFVKGTCPICSEQEQYGDICERCNNALKGINLINPKCTLCGRTPIQKNSEHYFFKLSYFAKQLEEWMKKPVSGVQPEVQNWFKEWLSKGLEDWCISRDAPYFGFEIPDSEKETGEKKFFYVWLDAPIGYISSTKNYCDKNKLNWKDYWYNGQVYHFIGKDISYFHYLFWPAMLMAVGIPVPKITTHGFIVIDDQKMSKSRGTFLTAKDFLKMYQPEPLRFYYASHLDRRVVDINLNFEELKAVTNDVLVGCLGNFCYRVLTFAEQNYGGVKEIAFSSGEKKLEEEINVLINSIKVSYLEQDYKTAVKNILKIADLGNAYFQKSEVWKDKESQKSREMVGWCVNLARNLSILISSVLPEFSGKINSAFNEKDLQWNNIGFIWKGKLTKVARLMEKIETVPGGEMFPLRMVVGKIEEVKAHPNADSLYLMKVDFGTSSKTSGLGKKQVVAGLKKYLKVEGLLGRKAVFCVNMKPAKIRGEMSEAMIFAAESGEGDNIRVAPLDAEKTVVGEEVTFAGMENSKEEVNFEEFQKLRMDVLKGRVVYNGKKLASKVEEIRVTGVQDGARVK